MTDIADHLSQAFEPVSPDRGAGMSSILQKMQLDEATSYVESQLPVYATDRAMADRVSYETALEEAKRQFSKLLPLGPETPGHHFYRIGTQDAGETAGRCWLFACPSSREAYVHDIRIFEAFQRRGFGRRAIRELESKARELHCSHLSLSVFAHNMGAIEFYRSAGLFAVGLRMSKVL